jgi:hypothetical protein
MSWQRTIVVVPIRSGVDPRLERYWLGPGLVEEAQKGTIPTSTTAASATTIPVPTMLTMLLRLLLLLMTLMV